MSALLLGGAFLSSLLALAPLIGLVVWKGPRILWVALAAIGIMGGAVWFLYALFDAAAAGFARWNLLHSVGALASLAVGAWAFSHRPESTRGMMILVTVSLFWLFFAGSFAGALWGTAYLEWRDGPAGDRTNNP